MTEQIWIVLIVVIGVVVVALVALWKNRHLSIGKGKDGDMRLDVGERGEERPAGSRVHVGEGITIENSSSVGDIAGLKTSARGVPGPIPDIEVAKGAHIGGDSTTGDIVGVKTGDRPDAS